jgi:hypothetical protein
MGKNKNKRGKRGRKVETRDPIQRFLIVCEGTQTEPNYFRSFRISTRPKVVSIEVKGIGKNPTAVVGEAIKLRTQGEYEQVWCVFDCDEFSEADITTALQTAERENIQVAYSNEGFEVWYLLHFNYYNTPLSRKSYAAKLSKLLGFVYRKNHPSLYEVLRAKQPNAITHARRLLNEYQPHTPYKNNPCTTVFRLVEKLNEFVR